MGVAYCWFTYCGCKTITAILSLIFGIKLLHSFNNAKTDSIDVCCINAAAVKTWDKYYIQFSELDFNGNGTCTWDSPHIFGEDLDNVLHEQDLSGDCLLFRGCDYQSQVATIADNSALKGKGWPIANVVFCAFAFIPCPPFGILKFVFSLLMLICWGYMSC